MLRPSSRRARASTVAVLLATVPGCLTYSSFQYLRDSDRKVSHTLPVFVGANLIGGAVVGTVAAAESDRGDRAISFAQGAALWNMLDIVVGLPLFAFAVFVDKAND